MHTTNRSHGLFTFVAGDTRITATAADLRGWRDDLAAKEWDKIIVHDPKTGEEEMYLERSDSELWARFYKRWINR